MSLASLQAVSGIARNLNVGYLWMLANCATSATYVSFGQFERFYNANSQPRY
jgi:hypothetical protein